MPTHAPVPTLLAALAGYVVVIGIQRLTELWLSARHARMLASHGGVEVRERRFVLFVVLHTLLPLAVAAEVLWLGARPGRGWVLWLLLFALAQALRVAAMRALGVRWNVRIWVLPGVPPLRRGPYRVMRHPNYLAVAIELLAGPLIFGAWRSALLASLFNALLLPERIRIEEQALAAAGSSMVEPPPG